MGHWVLAGDCVLAGSPGEGDAVAGITDKANQLCTSIEGDEVQDPQASSRLADRASTPA